MNKLTKLELDGNFTQGFRVTLQVSEDREDGNNAQPRVFKAYLPANPQLPGLYAQWRRIYWSLGLPYRLHARDGVTNVSLPDLSGAAIQVEQELNTWLCSPEFQPIRERLIETFAGAPEVRLIIQSSDLHVRQLPWHRWELLGRYPDVGLAFSDLTYDKPTVNRDIVTTGDLNVLVILGSSEGINVDADRQLLQHLPQATTTFLVEPTRQTLTEQLWSQQWDVLFFSGHSRTEGESGRIYINANDSLTIPELRETLGEVIRNGLQLAIFNSCDGLGIVNDLASLHIPEMLVMREPVPDQVAQTYLKYFIQAYAKNGVSLYRAAKQARAQLEGKGSEFPNATWLPVIYQNPAFTPVTWSRLRTCGRIAGGGFSPGAPLADTATASNSPTSQPSSRLRLPLTKFLIISMVATGLVLGVRSLGWLQDVELASYDQMIRSRPSDQKDDRILIITIDDEDLRQQNKTSPGLSLRHDDLDRLLKRLTPHQPAVVATAIVQNETVDARRYPALAKTLKTMQNYVGVCTVWAPDPNSSIPPTPELLENPQWRRFGFDDYIDVDERVLRRHLLAMDLVPRSSCQSQYAFSTIVGFHYLAASNKLPQAWQSSPTDHLYPEANWNLDAVTTKSLKIGIGGYQRHTNDMGGQQILLNYRAVNGSPNDAFEQIPLREILNTQMLERNPNLLRKKIILIGSISRNNARWKPTPYDEEIPVVIMRAQEISQLLDYAEGKRPLIWVWEFWQEVVWLLAWSVVGGAVGWRCRSLLQLSLSEIVVLILLYQISQAIFNRGIWLPTVPSAIVLVTSGTTVYTLSYRQMLK